MPNDFLSSLASRALQDTEVDSSAGGLSPRLASRFENPARPVLPAADQALDTEESIEIETRQERGVRKTTAAPGPNQPEPQDIQPVQSEQVPLRVMMHAQNWPEEARGFLQPAPGPAPIQYSQRLSSPPSIAICARFTNGKNRVESSTAARRKAFSARARWSRSG